MSRRWATNSRRSARSKKALIGFGRAALRRATAAVSGHAVATDPAMMRRADADVVDAFYHAFRSDGLAIARIPQCFIVDRFPCQMGPGGVANGTWKAKGNNCPGNDPRREE